MFLEKNYSHISNRILLCSIGCIVGIGIASTFAIRPEVPFLLFIAGCFGIAYSRSGKALIIALFCVSVAFGYGRYEARPTYDSNPFDQFITFSAEVVREPELLVDAQRLVVRSRKIHGLVQVQLPLQPRYSVGDQFEISCTVRKPEPFEGFRYDRFLERYHIGAVCYYPSATFIGSHSSIQRSLFLMKRRLMTSVQKSLAGPEHTIVLGSMFGLKRAIPKHMMNDFSITGTSHLLVISGLHFVLLIGIMTAILKQLSIPRRFNIPIIIVALLLYLVCTGCQASATRAVIMGSSPLIAELLGRNSSSLRLLIVSATGMLLVNPLLLLYDVGFQLSFLASAGIIVFQEWFEQRCTFITAFCGIRSGFATTVAAISTTWPIIGYAFNTFSLVAFIANVVLVPLMSLVMVFSIITICIAQFSEQLASWVSLPLYFLIHLMVDLVQWFARFPHASIHLPEMSATVVCGILICISVFGWRVIRSKQQVASI